MGRNIRSEHTQTKVTHRPPAQNLFAQNGRVVWNTKRDGGSDFGRFRDNAQRLQSSVDGDEGHEW